MFDPTVFENLKVVIEGALYDLDLEGKIVIIDRQDQVDLAKMGRHYHITFRDKSIDQIHTYIDLKMDLDNLVTELRDEEGNPGCVLEIGFVFKLESLDNCPMIQQILTTIWGETRGIQQEISFQYGSQDQYICNNKIVFHRLIHEDHIDDLLEMIDYIIDSIHQLHKVIL
ncbi:hypothetical protein E1I69_19120 [Bacillus timonensis]|uniref:Group-specific protein n=1 Tax=Bacillus timonensis TaxID=1033734 RepID=A0A4S3PLM4_9BACI|nr:hypothetical protein [Bacillus timonensis]THE10401.1 hypothetical protein E1I69_19120 [Bacillus timonensis]